MRYYEKRYEEMKCSVMRWDDMTWDEMRWEHECFINNCWLDQNIKRVLITLSQEVNMSFSLVDMIFRARVCVWVVVSVTCPCIHPFLGPRHSMSHFREDELTSFSSFKNIHIFCFDCSNLEIEVRINMIPKNVLSVQTFFLKKIKTN